MNNIVTDLKEFILYSAAFISYFEQYFDIKIC